MAFVCPGTSPITAAAPRRILTVFPFGPALLRELDPVSERVLGLGIVGVGAGELIAEYGLAMAQGMKAADISATIHTYPTFAQINRRVADMRQKEALTPSAKRWIQRIFRLRGA